MSVTHGILIVGIKMTPAQTMDLQNIGGIKSDYYELNMLQEILPRNMRIEGDGYGQVFLGILLGKCTNDWGEPGYVGNIGKVTSEFMSATNAITSLLPSVESEDIKLFLIDT